MSNSTQDILLRLSGMEVPVKSHKEKEVELQDAPEPSLDLSLQDLLLNCLTPGNKSKNTPLK